MCQYQIIFIVGALEYVLMSGSSFSPHPHIVGSYFVLVFQDFPGHSSLFVLYELVISSQFAYQISEVFIWFFITFSLLKGYFSLEHFQWSPGVVSC